MIPRAQKRGQSFKGVTAYLMHDKKAESSERVDWTLTGNMHTNDIEKASKVMAWTDLHAEELKQNAGISTAGRKATSGAVYHYSLSWAHGEEPEQEHMREQALETLKRQGLEEHQYYMVAHDDAKHAHVHIVVNLTNPEDGTRAELNHNKRALQGFALEYERENGVHCPNRESNHTLRQKENSNLYYKTQKARHGAQVTRAYELSDNAESFKNALENEGLILANGRKSFVAVDMQGNVINLARMVEGGRTKDIQNKLKDYDRDSLENAEELSGFIKEYNEERKQDDEYSTQKIAASEIELAQNALHDLQGWLDTHRGGGTDNNDLSSEQGGSAANDNALQQVRDEDDGSDTHRDHGEDARTQNADADTRRSDQSLDESLANDPEYYDRDAEQQREQDAIDNAGIAFEAEQRQTDWIEDKRAEAKAAWLEEMRPVWEQERAEREQKYARIQNRIDEKTAKSRETWQIDELTEQRDQAQVEFEEKNTFFNRIFRRGTISEKRDHFTDMQMRLEERLERHRTDIEYYNRNRPEALKNADLKKHGFEVDEVQGGESSDGLKAEKENAVLREAMSSPEAAERLGDQVQAKTPKERAQLAQVRAKASTRTTAKTHTTEAEKQAFENQISTRVKDEERRRVADQERAAEPVKPEFDKAAMEAAKRDYERQISEQYRDEERDIGNELNKNKGLER